MSFSTHDQAERKRRLRRRRWDFSAVFSLFGFLLIFSQICLLSSADKISSNSERRWSPARKARLFHNGWEWAAHHHHARVVVRRENDKSSSSSSSSSSSDDKLYEEEKRLVHTGPNPLHN
ncbi:hypothetical protein Salat_1331900 [Sesamum alatum]|uniref:Uncharacterized protein n=1 Tax=Sesamum alatum TaxID=300844 RepID=A0AAE1YHR7_9LAMI|nr:hypothetical protein Salat_1331900 [Sesamum alatum]